MFTGMLSAGGGSSSPQTSISNDGATARIAPVEVPAASSSDGRAGDIAYDNSHIYICVSENNWLRAALDATVFGA